LPFVTRPSDVGGPIGDRVPAGLGSVVKEVATIGPSPTIRIPPKSGHFTIEKNNLLFHSIFSGASIGTYNFNFMVGAVHSSTRILPCSKTSRMLANRETLNREWMVNIIPLE
jgi:hypothetical protein